MAYQVSLNNFSADGVTLDTANNMVICNSVEGTNNLRNRITQLHSDHPDIIYPANTIFKMLIGSGFQKICLNPNYSSDFNHCIFEISSTTDSIPSSNQCLFLIADYNNPVHEFSIDKHSIDIGDFSNTELASVGTCIVRIKDESPWTFRTVAGTNGEWTYRQDVLLVENGHAINRVVAPYDNNSSVPTCKWISASDNEKRISNLTIRRTSNNKQVIKCFHVADVNNIVFENIQIETATTSPALYNDKCFYFEGCTNIKVKKININNTYSSLTQAGYAFNLNNVWNFQAEEIVAWQPKWGVFGGNNVNTFCIDDSTINRVDVHSYGKNVLCKNCTFKYIQQGDGNYYNRFTSLFGRLTFEGCTFINFTPAVFDSAFNAWVGYDILIKGCQYQSTNTSFNHIIKSYHLSIIRNGRKELYLKCWPNVIVDGLGLTLPAGLQDFNIFYLPSNPAYDSSLGYINTIKFLNIDFLSVPSNLIFRDCNKTLTLSEHFRFIYNLGNYSVVQNLIENS